MNLILERKTQHDDPPLMGGRVAITPPIDENYWAYRVQLGHGQAIVGFPKFMTVGIGFALETDWNTNLPWTCEAEAIYQHIRRNKRFPGIRRTACLEAIRMVQDAARADDPRSDDEIEAIRERQRQPIVRSTK